MAHDAIKAAHDSIREALIETLTGFDPQPVVRVGGLSFEASEQPIVNVFFHSLLVNENGAKALPTRAPRAAGAVEEGYVFLPPPVSLTLGFLVTPVFQDTGIELLLMGEVLRCFQEQPRLLAPRESSVTDPISVIPDSRLRPERVTELFNSHGAPSRLSVGYVTRIEVRSDKVIREAPTTRTLNSKVRRQG